MAVAERTAAATAEDRFRRNLRDQLVAHIHEQDLDLEQVASIVGMLPSGARALMDRQDWSLRICLRVAESIGVEVRPTVETTGHRGR